MGIKGDIDPPIQLEQFDHMEDFLKPRPMGDTIPIPQDEKNKDKATRTRVQLIKPKQGRLSDFLKGNCDVFPHFINHCLNVHSKGKTNTVKERKYSIYKLFGIKEEVAQLLQDGYVRKVQYPQWLSIVLMVKKANEK